MSESDNENSISRKYTPSLWDVFGKEKICENNVKGNIEALEITINKTTNNEIKEKFIQKLEAIKIKYKEEQDNINLEASKELDNLRNQYESSEFEQFWVKIEIDKNNEKHLNLDWIQTEQQYLEFLKLIKKNINVFRYILTKSIFNTNWWISNELINSINKNWKLAKIISDNLENDDHDKPSLGNSLGTCPEDKFLVELRKIEEWIQNYEKSKEIILNKVPKDKKEEINNKIDWFLKVSNDWKGICSHSIINWISDLLKENSITGITDEEIKKILQTWVESQLIKEELKLNATFEDKLKKFEKNSTKDLTKEELKIFLEDPEVWDDKKEELKRFLADNEKNEKVIKDFTNEDVHAARNLDKEDFQNYIQLEDSISWIENYVLREYNLDLKNMSKSDINDILNNYKNIKKPNEKDKELIAVLEAYLELRQQKSETDKKIDTNESKKNELENKEILSITNQTNWFQVPKNNWDITYILLEWLENKISITKNWEKFIVKIGESSEECNEEELNNVVKAWKILVENWLSCIIWDIKNIMNILSKKFQFNFDAKDWMDSEETKLFFSGILHTLWEWDFNELKNMQKDEIFEKFKSFRYKNVTMLSKFQKSWIIWKDNNKFSIYAFEDKLKWIDSSKI